jgi:hypothetical protein
MYPCPKREARSQMTDEEFWTDVTESFLQIMDEPIDDFDLDDSHLPYPCPVCRSVEACGYDSEGRPMIHSIPVGDEDDRI